MFLLGLDSTYDIHEFNHFALVLDLPNVYTICHGHIGGSDCSTKTVSIYCYNVINVLVLCMKTNGACS